MRRSVYPPDAVTTMRSTVLLCLFCLAFHAILAAALCSYLGVWR